jgi:hypothetical protein
MFNHHMQPPERWKLACAILEDGAMVSNAMGP